MFSIHYSSNWLLFPFFFSSSTSSYNNFNLILCSVIRNQYESDEQKNVCNELFEFEDKRKKRTIAHLYYSRKLFVILIHQTSWNYSHNLIFCIFLDGFPLWINVLSHGVNHFLPHKNRNSYSFIEKQSSFFPRNCLNASILSRIAL